MRLSVSSYAIQIHVGRTPVSQQASPGPLIRIRMSEVGGPGREIGMDMTPGQTRQLIADLNEALGTPEGA